MARRDHGRAELRDKLLRKGHDPAEVDAALDRLADRGFIDDARTAQSLARYLTTSRGYGPAKVRDTLSRSRRLPRDLVQEAIGDLEVDWRAKALEVARGKRVKPDDPKAVERIARFLAGRGFAAELCWEAAKARVAEVRGPET